MWITTWQVCTKNTCLPCNRFTFNCNSFNVRKTLRILFGGSCYTSQIILTQEQKMKLINDFVLKHVRIIEMIGVLMRIFSFSLVSWLGPASPFMFVWVFNTIDAILLSWCAILKRDQAYTVLNIFWIMVGIVGILRASNFIH